MAIVVSLSIVAAVGVSGVGVGVAGRRTPAPAQIATPTAAFAATPVPGVAPAIASVNLGADPAGGTAMSIVLTARGRDGTQLTGMPLQWSVDFGDGTSGTCAGPSPCRVAHTYPSPRIYTAVAHVVDPAAGNRLNTRPLAIGVGQ